MIGVRVFRESDGEAVAGLWREVFPTPPPWNHPETDIARKLTVQPDLFFVAVAGDEIVGAVMAGFDGHRGWMYYLAVHPSRRRQGVGRALVGRVESALAERGCTKINLQIRSSNREVQAFYERLGYQTEDHVPMGKLIEKAPRSRR